jgi:hypothetical protein
MLNVVHPVASALDQTPAEVPSAGVDTEREHGSLTTSIGR